MKRLLVLFTILMVTTSLYAQQWNTNGTIIYNTNSGNVGIGTQTPTAKLDVVGTINAAGPVMSGSGFYIGTSPAFVTSGTETMFMPTKKLLIGSGPVSSTTSLLMLQTNSATTTFSSLTAAETGLVIRNSQSTNGNFGLMSFADNNGTDVAQFGSINTNQSVHSGKLFFATRNASGILAQRMVVDENGSVGIGTTSPVSALNVVEGDIRISATTTNRMLIFDATSAVNIASLIQLRRSNVAKWSFGSEGNSGVDDYVFFRYNDSGGMGTPLRLNRANGNAIFNDGNVGIGTTSPAYKLDVTGTASATTVRATNIQIVGGAPGAGKVLTSDASGNGSWQSAAGLSSQWTTSGSNINYNTAGMVSIGTATAPAGYKLAVGGKIVAEEVVVKLQSNWPDYVFESKYQLPALSELEKFIALNKHLPDVPSAEEVKENGVKVGEMESVLLKKIEELTLYVIEANKRIDALQNEVQQLKSN
jgi:hypothetical protein